MTTSNREQSVQPEDTGVDLERVKNGPFLTGKVLGQTATKEYGDGDYVLVRQSAQEIQRKYPHLDENEVLHGAQAGLNFAQNRIITDGEGQEKTWRKWAQRGAKGYIPLVEMLALEGREEQTASHIELLVTHFEYKRRHPWRDAPLGELAAYYGISPSKAIRALKTVQCDIAAKPEARQELKRIVERTIPPAGPSVYPVQEPLRQPMPKQSDSSSDSSLSEPESAKPDLNEMRLASTPQLSAVTRQQQDETTFPLQTVIDDSVVEEILAQGDSMKLYFRELPEQIEVPELQKRDWVRKAQLADEVKAHLDKGEVEDTENADAIILQGTHAREKLAVYHQRLVCKIAGLYKNKTTVEYPDLIQMGNLGLLKAIEKYSPSSKVEFATFAAKNIKFSILNELAQVGLRSRVPVAFLYEYLHFVNTWSDASDASPSIGEVAREMGISEKRAHTYLQALHINHAESAGSETISRGTHTDVESHARVLYGQFVKLLLAIAPVSQMGDFKGEPNQRAVAVFLLRSGIFGKAPQLKELSKQYGISHQVISALEKTMQQRLAKKVHEDPEARDIVYNFLKSSHSQFSAARGGM